MLPTPEQVKDYIAGGLPASISKWKATASTFSRPS